MDKLKEVPCVNLDISKHFSKELDECIYHSAYGTVLRELTKNVEEKHEQFLIQLLNSYDIAITKDNIREFKNVVEIAKVYDCLADSRYIVRYCGKPLCSYEKITEMKNDGGNYVYTTTFREIPLVTPPDEPNLRGYENRQLFVDEFTGE